MTSARERRNKSVWGPRRVGSVLLVCAMLLAAPAGVLAQQPAGPGGPGGNDGFVPVTQADLMQEQLPAAPLVLVAYAVAWLAVFGYLWFLWQRLNRVEKELADVSRRIQPEVRR